MLSNNVWDSLEETELIYKIDFAHRNEIGLSIQRVFVEFDPEITSPISSICFIRQ